MKYIVEESLEDFDFWGQARNTAENLTRDEFRIVENILSEDEEITDVQINDLFAYEPETIYEWVGKEKAVIEYDIENEWYIVSVDGEEVTDEDGKPIRFDDLYDARHYCEENYCLYEEI